MLEKLTRGSCVRGPRWVARRFVLQRGTLSYHAVGDRAGVRAARRAWDVSAAEAGPCDDAPGGAGRALLLRAGGDALTLRAPDVASRAAWLAALRHARAARGAEAAV